ncbi:1-acyl-sn-glycerol-3-phosphate acyltransferase [Verrucomicrobiaceae bacterium R5-34]|uniref:1-acyl-sn-glycerol-3-phosphate acyltransferase n=1 Tax=Oceaniferula flava TaxID=2800421 RepID=A0AAE2VAX0_9BACT|nr:lysophospholipid acyltransferase family protein [Oceaniferula flavus]MBK1829670.1 1-acyl-sn-glycerol-3-phosphate acyltransferase [Verrucomicrobiaceae bacterium R5-34]MBK1853860.1 1-acyl-sn-glycerol-3-phosphate acyltransferase [Oceaniferula flavus]MBM1135166.1 1-acyl-sn-glycerol-3-phosphate acyltransferase [Oceaniferula flavus]
MKTIYWFCYRLWQKCFVCFFAYRVIGKEKLVTDGPVLIASNHESFLDPPLVGIAYEQEVYYLARKTLFRGFGAWLYPRLNSIPVDQERPDMTSLKTIIKLLRQGNQVVVFPEGARTLDGKLQKAEAGTGLIVAKSKAVVQPVRIFGARKALPRGSSKMNFCPITLVVGDPISFTPEELKAKGRDDYQKISDKIMAEIAKLEM